MAVIDIINQVGEMKIHRYEFVLWQRKWQEHRGIYPLSWRVYPLAKSQRAAIPQEPGIYTLLVQPGIANHPACSYLMYVGQTKSLRRRFGDYLNERRRETGRPKILLLLNLYPEHTWFCFSPVPMDKLDAVESALITAYIPPANDQLPAEVSAIRRAF